jgi:integrase
LGEIDRLSIEGGRDKRRAKPEAANSFVKVMRALYAWAVDAEPDYVKENPARAVKLLQGNPTGFHTWTVDEVEQFRAFHKPGSKARLAMDLLLFTGLRRSDLVAFGRQHLRNGVLEIRPYKTRETSSISVMLPVLPALASAIAEGPTGDMTFIVSERGTPFTAESFTNWFKDRCREAGVPGSAHGLRKAAATIAAENGATEQHLLAMFGWSTPRMAALYTKTANRRKLALAGSAFMPGGEQDGNTFPRTSAPGAGKIAKS